MSNIWVTEQLYPTLRLSLCVEKVLHEERSEYQRIQVLQTAYLVMR